MRSAQDRAADAPGRAAGPATATRLAAGQGLAGTRRCPAQHPGPPVSGGGSEPEVGGGLHLCQRLMADQGITCSMSRSGNVWDNAAMESYFSSLKTERLARKIYRTCDAARARCSTTSSGSTTRRDATRRSAISAPWRSSAWPVQAKPVSIEPAAGHASPPRVPPPSGWRPFVWHCQTRAPGDRPWQAHQVPAGPHPGIVPSPG